MPSTWEKLFLPARHLARTGSRFRLRRCGQRLISLPPLLNVMMSFCGTFKWQAAEGAIKFAVADYFPIDLFKLLKPNLLYTRRFELISLILLLFTANGIFEPLEVALNRAWESPRTVPISRINCSVSASFCYAEVWRSARFYSPG